MCRVYFAGPLFDHKHLVGNRLLAEAVHALAGGRYQAVLPQDLPIAAEDDPRAIRNADYAALLSCDAAIFHFDGPELDSGTVAEFIMAKVADTPAVLFRSDFRSAGDQLGGDPWNLMCYFFPRTENLVINAMANYARHREAAPEAFLEDLASAIVEKLDQACAAPPVLTTPSERIEHLKRLTRLIGGGFELG